jgi:N-acetyl-alpha-D-muramate 1-phosphate uridylyltransferase
MIHTAMILAAGRGERMRPLTDHCPKPLLEVAGTPLIVWHLRRLAQAGIQQVVINHAHLGAMIETALGDGRQWGLQIHYSAEPQALETAGGIATALPLIGSQPFLVINGDIFTDWPIGRVRTIDSQMRAADLLAWCVLIDNPAHNPNGDFALDAALLRNQGSSRLTYSGIAVFDPRLFEACVAGQKSALAPLLRSAADQQRIGGEYFSGRWVDVGTPQRLAELDQLLRRESRTTL